MGDARRLGEGKLNFDLEEVALSALLSGIGDFLRDEEVFGGEARLSREPHHDISSIAAAAHELASSPQSGERGSLKSPFSFVQLGKRGMPAGECVYRPAEYGGREISSYFPMGGVDGAGDRCSLAGEMVAGLRGLDDPLDVTSVLNLIERYGSYVPAAGTDDVSLYDHARTAAAIAVCIAGDLGESGAESTAEEIRRADAERYLFVRGDLSGVQGFLYTLTSKGALKMLRARSLYLELLTEHAAARMLRWASVPRTNIVFVGGGGFQLLLPNTEESQRAVKEMHREVNDALVESFGRDLYMAVASVSCDARGIREDLPGTLGSLAHDLSEGKNSKFRPELEDLFSGTREPHVESCQVCTRDDLPTDRYYPKSYESYREGSEEEPLWMCGTCHMLAVASRKLVESAYLKEGGRDLCVGETGYWLSDERDGAAYALDGVGDPACLKGAVPLPAARYAAPDDEEKDQIADFDQIAERARGVELLAVLRMDVDSLGEIFGKGLPEERRTFDRYAALSRSFTTFFKMVAPLICAGEYDDEVRIYSQSGERRAVMVVYSGGDDLFIVGAWNEVFEIAVEIRHAFRRFVCNNPSVTISGGISLHKPGEPLYLMAERAGKAEETAKSNQENGREKDSAVLFYSEEAGRESENPVPQALFWEDVEEVVSLLRRINSFRNDDGKLPFPRGFTRMLMEVVEIYEREGELSLPRLAYALTRMEESGKLKDDEDWQGLKNGLLEIETIKKHLRPAAFWLDLAERENKEAEDGQK